MPTPPETPPTPEAPEIREEISTEMAIQTNLPPSLSSPSIPTGNEGYRLLSTAQGVMLGIGAYTASYLPLRDLDLPGIASFASRVGIGLAAGGVFGAGMHRLVSGLKGTYIADNLKKGETLQATRALAHASFGAVALAGLLVPAAGNFLDFEGNLILARQIAETQERLQALINDPRGFSVIADMETAFHREVIETLTPKGEFTPGTYARMLLYYDGQQIEFNPTPDPGVELKSARTEIVNDQAWVVGFFDSSSWLIQGPSTSWWVGFNGADPTVGEVFEAYRADHDALAPYAKILMESGKIDGVPTALEIVSEIDSPPPLVNLSEGIDRLHAWAPFEWNDRLRTRFRERAKQAEADIVNPYSEAARVAHEAHFGPGVLEEPFSYAATLKALSQLP